MFRGKESSNRIELSRLVQDLLNFSVLGSLRLLGWGVGGWGWGWLGGAPYTCAHARACMQTHTRTRTYGKHDNFMQMAAPIGGIPGNSLWCHTRVCAHACMRVRVHVGKMHPLTTPTPIHPSPHPPGGDPRNHSKFNST